MTARERSYAWRLRNLDSVRAAQKKYNNSDEGRRKNKEYREKNREEIKRKNRLAWSRRGDAEKEKHRLRSAERAKSVAGKEKKKAWLKAQPLRARGYILKCKYKRDLAFFQNLYLQQGRRCGLCRKSATFLELVVDHDHKTTAIRGLIHHCCNVGLGGFKDNPLIVAHALRYLQAAARKGESWHAST